MTWAIVLIHIVGNPVLTTTEPRFATLPECRAHVERLNAGSAKLWEHVCWRSE